MLAAPGLDVASTLDFLGAHAVPGLETYSGGAFTRVVTADHGPSLVEITAATGSVRLRVLAGDPRDAAGITARVRSLLDLDARPDDVDGTLAADPALAPLIALRPGLCAPGSVEGFETAVRVVVGQQISLVGARTVLGRIVAGHGDPAFAAGTDEPGWRRFPTAERLAAVDPTTLPMPRARGRSVQALAAAVAAGGLSLDGPRPDLPALRAALLALPGIGPWTADYLAMRVFGDRDVLLASDLVVRRAAADLEIELADGRPGWAPYRTYATHHLWAHLVAERWRTQR